MNIVDRSIAWVENGCQTFADLSIFLIMIVVCCDVVMRYLFNSPLQWAYGLISLYLMAAVFFLSLSSTYAANGHIGMELFLEMLPAKGRRLSEILTCLISIPLFAFIAMFGAERAYSEWINNEVVSGLIAWPTWIGVALVPVGCGLVVLRLSFRLVGHVASFVSGKDVIPAPPVGLERGE
jgi:TRAP-type C4-dicarboxylate transport system permease small subunit